ncbi:MAG: DUF350 domain-containing protein [Deltaproteobacteria bacterium]|jgi:putative membrane protein|nr:DUF350 domain-containing protein [Deltaproteobacteria bacterium]
MNKVKFYFVTTIMLVSGTFGFVRVSTANQEGEKQEVKKVEAQKAAVQKTAPTQINKRSKRTGGIFAKIYLADIISTLFYSLMGLAVALFGYKVYDIITPFDLKKELEVDQNTSLGIVVGSIILGLSLIIAASIMSP